MINKQYPYQKLLLKDIKGEQWVDIPGFDGYYLISNLKIIKPVIVKQYNKFVGDYVYFLTIRFVFLGKRYNSTVARLVYNCFVESFDLGDSSKVIISKDYDNFNIRPSNLLATTLGQRQIRAFARSRSRSAFLDFSDEFKTKIREKIVKSNIKQITQYSLAGRKIKTYPSASAAQQDTGIYATSIGNIANGNNLTAGGFVWRWGNERKIHVRSFIEDRKKKQQKNYDTVSITQYDMEGNRIAQYPSLTDAQ